MSGQRSAGGQDLVTPTPWWASLVLGAAGGLAAIAAFPPYDLWWLLPIGIALLILAVLTRRVIGALLGAFAWGLAFFVPLTEWASTYAGTQPWLALAVFESLYIVLFGLLARTVLVRRGIGAASVVVVASLWVGVETLRSHAPWGGLPWGATGFALSGAPLLNLGSWIGMAGLALVVALLGGWLALGVLMLTGRRASVLGRLGGVWPIATAVLLVLTTIVVPQPVNRAPQDRGTVTVAAVQGSMTPIDPATLAMPVERFDNNVRVTRAVIDQSRRESLPIDLVLWPEDATAHDPRRSPYDASVLTALASSAQAPILLGTQTPVGEDQRLNTAVLWTGQGTSGWEYHKRHPVPFGEYVPYREFFRRLSPLVDEISMDMVPGDRPGVLDLSSVDGPPARLGVLICFEIAYDTLVHDVVDHGAEAILVQSNNALFGTSHEAIQQLAEAKVMAVISGRAVVHLSTVGHSAVFTPDGRVMQSVGHWKQGSMLVQVPLRSGITPAAAAGVWPAVALSAVGAAGLAGALASPRRAVRRARDLTEGGRR